MNLLNNAKNYRVLPLPVTRPLCELSHHETDTFFQWFLSHVEERINYLTAYISLKENTSESHASLSPDSLIPLWAWFISVAQIEKPSRAYNSFFPAKMEDPKKSFSDYIANSNEKCFSVKTEYILRDVGMYLGQVFVENNPCIFWTYYEQPKEDFFVNTPVLSGFEDSRFTPPFKMVFEPIHMAGVQAAKLLKDEGRNEDLYNLYCEWVERFVPN